MTDIQGIFANGSQVVAKAGSGYPQGYDSHMASGLVQSEGVINTLTRFDYTSAVTADTITSGGLGILNDTSSSLVAIQAITFDLNSYPNRIQAEDMINVNRDNALRNMSILRDKNVQKFIANI